MMRGDADGNQKNNYTDTVCQCNKYMSLLDREKELECQIVPTMSQSVIAPEMYEPLPSPFALALSRWPRPF
jgi:hypothetical protein